MTTLKNTGTKNQKIIIIPVDALLGKGFAADKLKVKSSIKGCCKRSLPRVGHGPKEKRQKMDAFAQDILFKFKRVVRFLGARAAKGDKEDGVELRQEKERLEKQQSEKARKDYQIKVATVGSRKSAEVELKTKREQEREADLKSQRERERKAARLALHQIEKTVEFDDNFQVLKDFQTLSQCPLAEQYRGFEGGPETILQLIECCHSSNPWDDYIEDKDRKKREQEREAELKRQREQERKAARLALEQIVKTVEFNDGFQIMKDFYTLIQCYPNNATAEVEEGEILPED